MRIELIELLLRTYLFARMITILISNEMHFLSICNVFRHNGTERYFFLN